MNDKVEEDEIVNVLSDEERNENVDDYQIQSPKSSVVSARIDKQPRSAPPTKQKKNIHDIMTNIITSLVKKDIYGFFLKPVDTNLVPDYLSVIKRPMDFETVKEKTRFKLYNSFDDFKNDIFLIFSNAKKYNSPETIYHKEAQRLEASARKSFDRILQSTKPEDLILTKVDRKIAEKFEPHYVLAEELLGKTKKKRALILCSDGTLEPESLNEAVMQMLPKLTYPYTHASSLLSKKVNTFNTNQSFGNIPHSLSASTYVDSIKLFSKDFGPKLSLLIEKRISDLNI